MGRMGMNVQSTTGDTVSGRSGWSRIACALHLLLLCVLVPLVVAMPPAGGLILVLPAGTLPADDGWLRQHGAEPVGPGRFSDSIVVRGAWWRLVLPALGRGAILMSASGAGCVAAGEDKT